MDKMKAEIEKILEELLKNSVLEHAINGMALISMSKKAKSKATSSITSLIIKWLEGKKVKVEERYSGLSNGYFTELDTKNIGRNQLITELIGEVR